jgi:hypothetical protein
MTWALCQFKSQLVTRTFSFPTGDICRQQCDISIETFRKPASRTRSPLRGWARHHPTYGLGGGRRSGLVEPVGGPLMVVDEDDLANCAVGPTPLPTPTVRAFYCTCYSASVSLFIQILAFYPHCPTGSTMRVVSRILRTVRPLPTPSVREFHCPCFSYSVSLFIQILAFDPHCTTGSTMRVN